MSPRDRNGGPLRVVYDRPRNVQGLLPPHDLEAERAVLCGAILVPELRAAACDELTPADCYDFANARVLEGVIELAKANTPPDLVTLRDWLRDHELLEKVGGQAYLVDLCEASPDLRNFRAHLKIVREKGAMRRVIAMCEGLAAEGRGDVGDRAVWLAEAPERIVKATGSLATGERDFSLDAALAESFAELDDLKPGQIAGIPTGIHALDQLTGGTHGEEIVLIGAPSGAGKSTLVGQIAFAAANRPFPVEHGRDDCGRCRPEQPCDRHSWDWNGVIFFALEGKRKDYTERASCAHARLDLMGKRTGKWGAAEVDRFVSSGNHLRGLPVKIDDRKDLTVAKLGARVRAQRDAFASHGVKLRVVVLDYVQLLQLATGGNREQDLNDAMRSIVALAGEPDLAGIRWLIVTQLNKDGEARESRSLEMHADSFWVLTVDEAAETDGAQAARILVKKQRRGPKMKTAACWFMPKWTLFYD